MIPACASSASLELPMGRRRRMDDHRVDAPERGGQLRQPQRVDDRPTGRPATFDLEGEHAAGDARAGTGERHVVLGMARQARIEDRTHAVLALEPGRQCRGRGSGVSLGPDGEGQDPAQHQEGLQRPEGRAGVDLDAARPPRSASPTRRRRRRSRRCGRPGTSSPTRRRGPPRARAAGRRTARRTCCRRRRSRRGDAPARPAPRGRPGRSSGWRSSRRRGRGSARRRGRGDGVEVGRVDDVDPDAEAAERAQELGARRAVQRDRRDDPIAGPQQRGERGMDRAHPRRQGEAGRPAGQLRVGVPSAVVVGFEIRL